MEKTYLYRTDLLDEAEEIVAHRTKSQKNKLDDTEGIKFDEREEGRMYVTTVEVSKEAEERINKKRGTYVTISCPTLYEDDQQQFEQLEKLLLSEIKKLHKSMTFDKNKKILVIGLGNKTITPDAIGPYAIDALTERQVEMENSPFIIYAPGVTAQTGFETKDFIAALVEKIQPMLVIVVDALAARSSSRLCRTIQMTNTGIHPGSGVGNSRAEVSYETLGVPVTAIGIPTVVDGITLIAEGNEIMMRTLAAKIARSNKPSSKLAVVGWRPDDQEEVDMTVLQPIFGEWAKWTPSERLQLLHETFAGQPEALIVTPKEMDGWLLRYAQLISSVLFQWQH